MVRGSYIMNINYDYTEFNKILGITDTIPTTYYDLSENSIWYSGSEKQKQQLDPVKAWNNRIFVV
jgi:hypothetical protein